jgi:periplasmic divalent cation tolerance protein
MTEQVRTGDAGTLLVITTLPDADSAAKVASSLVERRLAACVNILQAGTSVYEWEGEIHQDPEHVLLIKTSEARYGRLQTALMELHPYELPEIIAVPIIQGLPRYLHWIEESTS